MSSFCFRYCGRYCQEAIYFFHQDWCAKVTFLIIGNTCGSWQSGSGLYDARSWIRVFLGTYQIFCSMIGSGSIFLEGWIQVAIQPDPPTCCFRECCEIMEEKYQSKSLLVCGFYLSELESTFICFWMQFQGEELEKQSVRLILCESTTCPSLESWAIIQWQIKTEDLWRCCEKLYWIRQWQSVIEKWKIRFINLLS